MIRVATLIRSAPEHVKYVNFGPRSAPEVAKYEDFGFAAAPERVTEKSFLHKAQ